MIVQAKEDGETPFFVNAPPAPPSWALSIRSTPSRVSVPDTGLWMHVDGSWGGAVAFSPHQRHKLKGVERADSVAICPHKMLGVGLTCSVLLGRDLRSSTSHGPASRLSLPDDHGADEGEFWDLGDLTPHAVDGAMC